GEEAVFLKPPRRQFSPPWCAPWRSARLPPAIPDEVPMRRIGLAVVLALSLVFVPLGAAAQQTGKVYRVGYLSPASAHGPGDEVVRLNVDLIVVWSPAATVAGKNATNTIPVVFLAGGEAFEPGPFAGLPFLG